MMVESQSQADRMKSREAVKARLAHLVPRKQQEIERAVRLLRVHFVDRRPRSPRCGILHRMMLVGPHARPGEVPDRETGSINHYEIWAFVDHAAYRGRRRYWGLALQIASASLRGRATIELSVFTLDEIDRWRAAGNRFLLSRFEGGVVLYEHSASPSGGEQSRRG